MNSKTEGDVRAAILIPAYGQPGLTAEALHTAIAQQADFAFAVVVVNDGCPSPETHEICLNFAATYPGKVFYLKKANGGLSAARNSGLEFALSAFPALEAVYFLDCDNHIGPLLLQRMVDALRASDETVGWAYADVDKFGFASFGDTSGRYSPLEHLFRSFCEAGSMVSRRMLDAGARFDTAMRKGVEDWDFWLQGLGKGFRGVHVADAGFRYRRRGESMLVEAERDIAPILAYIRGKHAQLYNVKSVLRLEIEARARYAIHHPDTGFVRCMTATGMSELITLDDYLVRLMRAAERPDYGHCPGHLIVMDQALFDTLAGWRLLSGVLWKLECAVMQAAIAACSITLHPSPDRTVRWRAVSSSRLTAQQIPSPPETAQVVAIEAGALLAQQFPDGAFATGNHWHAVKPFGGRFFDLEIGRAHPGETPPAVGEGFASLQRRLEAVAVSHGRALWRAAEHDRYRARAAVPRDLYPELFNTPSVFPPAASQRSVALVVDDATPAAIALAAQLAEALREEGYGPHLVSFGALLPYGAAPPADFDEIVALPLDSLCGTEASKRQSYLGTSLPLLDWRDRQAALATLAAYSRVVSVGSHVLHLIAGALRQLKVETWAVLVRPDEQSAVDSVTACSAFEQAYDAIVPDTEELLHLCRALGIPARKLRLWPDAARALVAASPSRDEAAPRIQ
ncbi:glycosyltransferase family A protein [Bosea sp. BK604]|uniref:glycosyltransferase family A protein n=1 Tax=Bosea sp. BK604 TaxID=2512180 RepID=UPI0010CE5BF2|nr:glycosyltransferase family A protein [Bosea sp. BK604]TCR66575.1 glycosyltransferase involved in cell wall biosynthesis [Bosea sp. BK604]